MLKFARSLRSLIDFKFKIFKKKFKYLSYQRHETMLSQQSQFNAHKTIMISILQCLEKVHTKSIFVKIICIKEFLVSK